MKSTALKDKFSSSNNSMATAKRSAAALGLATLLSFSSATMAADSEQCKPLEKINGTTLSSGASAYYTSKDAPFPLVVEAKSSKTMGVGNVPTSLVEGFQDRDVLSHCYIANKASESGKPEFIFYITGEPYKHTNGKTVFHIEDILNDKSILPNVIDKAKLAQTLSASQNNAENTLSALIN